MTEMIGKPPAPLLTPEEVADRQKGQRARWLAERAEHYSTQARKASERARKAGERAEMALAELRAELAVDG